MSKKEPEGFEAMLGMWQQGQEAFFKAQEEVSEQFRKSLENMPGSVGKSDTDPFAAWQSLIKAWSPTWGVDTSPNPFDFSPDFTGGKNMFHSLLDPQKWTNYAPEQLRVILEKIAKGPQFADLATPQYAAATAWRENLDYQQAAADMSKVMQSAWADAYELYSKKFSLEDLQSANMQEALDEWLKAANTSLLNAQGSDEFLDAQKRLIRASTEIRARQRDMAEEWSEVWQMPTRTEVDDLTLHIHQLRRELREVRRELQSLKDKSS